MGTQNDFYHTPNLERLANNGLSFTHAYAQPNCAPTRAAMLTGQYPTRVNNRVYVVQHLNRFGKDGIKKSEARFRGPEQAEDVAVAAVTVAEALQQNGYATAHIGKYHVGGHEGDATLPENAGFDVNLGGFSQGHQPTCFAKEKSGAWCFPGVGRGDFDTFAAPYSEAYVERRELPTSLVGTPKHICDALGDALERTVGELAAREQPFYLQFHSYAVHGPVRARADLLAEARSKYGDQLPARMLEYLGFIAGMDENLGRILATIEDPDGDGDASDSIAANTLVLFTSDNGGTHADNLPLKGKKGMLTEGGIRVPLVAYWKGVIPANTVTDRLVHSVDYYPTYLELAGGAWSPPARVHPLDGQSFAGVLRNPGAAGNREPIFYLFPGYLDNRAQPSAVAIGDLDGERYKLMYSYEPDAWELYCLSDDPAEQRNRVSSQRDVAATLSRRLHAWLTQQHPTWQPAYPLDAESAQPVGPPPILDH